MAERPICPDDDPTRRGRRRTALALGGRMAMRIVNVGLSHRSAPVGVLDRLAVHSAELPDVLTGLHALPAVDEVAVLSTCNRIEVYAATRGAVGSVIRAAADVLAVRSGLPAGELLRLARVHVD